MDDERRYDEDEVERIFREAAQAETSVRPHHAARDGLTLPELQAIGAEAGIPAELVSEAAAALDRGTLTSSGGSLDVARTRFAPAVLGIPLGVAREEQLPRTLTEEEWGRLVMDLRRTFSARGHVDVAGEVREWRNGNLFVGMAPAEGGARLIMGTRKGDATPVAGASLFFLLFAATLFIAMVLSGEIAEAGAIVTPVILGALGLGGLAVNAARLPVWARTRAAQFEEVVDRARALTAGEVAGSGREADDPSDSNGG